MLRSLFLLCLLRVLANMLSVHTVVDGVFVVGEFCLLYKNCTLSDALSIKLFQHFSVFRMMRCLCDDYVSCLNDMVLVW